MRLKDPGTKLTLKNRLLLATTICTLLVVATFLIADRVARSHQLAQKVRTNVAYTQALWSAVSGARFDAMENETKGLTRNRDAIKALKVGDPAALHEAVLTSFNRISANGGLDGLLIANNDGRRLVRIGRGSNTALALSVATEQKVRRELVSDDEGRPALAVAFPLYSRGKAKGVAVYLLGLETVIGQIAQNANAVASLLGPDGVLLHSTDNAISQGVEWPKLARGEADWRMLNVGDKAYAATTVPLLGFDGELKAQLALQHDFTQVAAGVRRIDLIQTAVIAAVVLLAVLVIFQQMSVAFRPLNKASEAMAAIARGDLSFEVVCESRNEIAEMLVGMQNMRDYLRGVIGAIHDASEELNQVAYEASEVAERSVSGATQQKSDTDSVATAMTEMASTVHSVADSAHQAADAARNADATAQQGQVVVQTTVEEIRSLAGEVRSGAEAIERLRRESDAIGQILDVIRGIAEQTNLLALNAAIEAARAGEQGRGFAVVADEVRTLASRTQASTTEIQSMIERLQQGTHEAVGIMDNSRQHAEHSEIQVQAAGEALNSITSAVGEISAMNAQIADAAAEQGRVAEEINRSIINISQVAEQTVVGAGQSTAANERISGLTGRLQKLVGNFRV